MKIMSCLLLGSKNGKEMVEDKWSKLKFWFLEGWTECHVNIEPNHCEKLKVY
jgi:hypothetical protein